MNDVEHELKNLARRPPPASLDARVERALENAAPLMARPVPAWACALAAVIGLATGLGVARHPARADGAGLPKNLLVATAKAEASKFPFIGRNFVQP